MHGIDPDIAIFGKTLGNGYAINAIIGRAEVMEAANRTFISSTFWTERIGPAAALAALDAMREEDAPAQVHEIGAAVRAQWHELAASHGLPMVTSGLAALSAFRIEDRDPALVKSFVTRRLLAENFLAGPSLYTSVAHDSSVRERYLSRLDGVFGDLSRTDDEFLGRIVGPGIAWTGFGRLS